MLSVDTSTGIREGRKPADTVSTSAHALAAELLGVTAHHVSRRAILTTSGLVAIDVVDRFTELAVELHWSVVTDVLAGRPSDQLAEFRGFRLDGHELAYGPDQIPSAEPGQVRR